MAASAVQAAVQAGSLGIGFSGTGFLLPVYFIGVLDVLRSIGIINKSTKAAGASGGAVMAAVFCSEAARSDLYNYSLNFSRTCYDSRPLNCPAVRLSVGEYLKAGLQMETSEASAELCSGRIFVTLTKAGSRLAEVVSEFSSQEDLVDAVLASSHIPIVSDRRLVFWFRGKPYNDGIISEWLPCPPKVQYCVRVSVLAAGTEFVAPGLGPVHVGETDIDPFKFGTNRYSNSELLKYTSVPPPVELLEYMRDKGRQDAHAWARQQKLL